MPRVIDEPIAVYISNSSALSAFIWRKRVYRVISVLCCWREPAEWWNREPVRFVFRIRARRRVSGIYELSRLDDDWFMYRVVD